MPDASTADRRRAPSPPCSIHRRFRRWMTSGVSGMTSLQNRRPCRPLSLMQSHRPASACRTGQSGRCPASRAADLPYARNRRSVRFHSQRASQAGTLRDGCAAHAVLPLIMPDAGKPAASTSPAPPQNPHKSGSSGAAPTRIPRTIRHYPAHGGIAARMDLLALTGHYAGRAGLARSRSRVAQGAIDPLKSGRSVVRPRP
jgi:hypothetical protein